MIYNTLGGPAAYTINKARRINGKAYGKQGHRQGKWQGKRQAMRQGIP